MRKDIILTMLSFNAVTAIGGGIMLMTGGIEPPSVWLQNTVFASYFIPGLILAGVVGGSALLAAIRLRRQPPLRRCYGHTFRVYTVRLGYK